MTASISKQAVLFLSALSACGIGVSACGVSENVLSSDRQDGGSTFLDTDFSTDTGVGKDSSTGTGVGADSDSNDCATETVQATEVLLIGDSWIWRPGLQLVALARDAGTVGETESYVILAADGASMDAAVNQYDTQQAGVTKVKVLIMDGGGIDLIAAGGSAESAQQVVDAFELLLRKVENDGTVEHVIYSLYPEGTITPGVATLRPGMQAVCAASSVPCYFLDLQSLWEGRPEYTTEDAINPSDEGSEVIARAIWNIMQQNCVAQ